MSKKSQFSYDTKNKSTKFFKGDKLKKVQWKKQLTEKANKSEKEREFGGNGNDLRRQYREAKSQYQMIRKQKQEERGKRQQRKMEIQTALNKYKEKKKIKNKRLSAKTAKGQPVMRTRIEMLLEKIQSSQ